MNEQQSAQNINETWPPFSDYSTISEAIREWPELLREIFQLTSLRPGLTLVVVNFRPQDNLIVKGLQVERSPLEFSFYLSGTVRSEWTYGLRQRNEYVTEPGKTGLWFVPSATCTIECLAQQSVRWVIVRIEPWLLNTLFEGQFDQIPPNLRAIVEGFDKNYYKRIGTITASIQMTIHQILNCPYQGSIKRMYLESKAIELISHQLAQLAFAEFRSKRFFLLRSDDIERIHDAKGILVRNMENPPSLLDLALQVGLNDTKLKRGFRQIFGTTVFGYLQLKRLERARSLLEERNMNVSEVAATVGYSSLSHFAKVFKQHFGTKPSFYLSELLNKAD